PALIYAKDLEGRYLFANRRFEQLFGTSRDAIRGRTDYDILDSKTAARIREHDRQVRLAGEALEFEERVGHGGDEHVYFSVKFPLRNASGEIYAICGTATDITDLEQAHASLADSEARYRALFEAAGDAIFLMHEDRFIECNARTLEMFDCSREEIVGQPPHRFSPPRQPDGSDSAAMASEQIAAAYGGERQHFEWEHLRLDGSPFSAEVTLNRLELGGRAHLLALVRDVTERRLYLEALEHQATHDPLTDLPNRSALRNRLQETIDRNEAERTPFALLLMDLNRFKEINDTLGHHVGDEILVKIGPRLQPIMHRHSATLFRLGGDEFAILLPEVQDPAGAQALADAILEALRQPFQLARFSLEVGASIGIAFYPEHGADPSTLLRCADVAMYSCKRALLGQAVYSGEIDNHSPLRLTLMSELGKAIDGQQLFLHYQPKIDLGDGRVAGYEALVRWRHPEHGMIPPGEFIPVVEMTELIRPLTLWVLDEALAQLRLWRDQGSDACIAVNLSARNLLDQGLVTEIEHRLARHGVPPHALELEITESTLMAEPKRALAVLNSLDVLGVRLAIDDFGTGYSSLGYLRHLPVNALKIDRSFVAGMLDSPKDAMIVRSTIDLAHNMDLQVIAEGIENAQTLHELREMRCDQAQGYFISRPLPAEELDAFAPSLPQ
ncbi:MAG: EAL domain-containing protein, partial [Chromatiales bacterium]